MDDDETIGSGAILRHRRGCGKVALRFHSKPKANDVISVSILEGNHQVNEIIKCESCGQILSNYDFTIEMIEDVEE